MTDFEFSNREAEDADWLQQHAARCSAVRFDVEDFNKAFDFTGAIMAGAVEMIRPPSARGAFQFEGNAYGFSDTAETKQAFAIADYFRDRGGPDTAIAFQVRFDGLFEMLRDPRLQPLVEAERPADW